VTQRSFAPKSKQSAKGAEYKSQGQARSEAERVAPGEREQSAKGAEYQSQGQARSEAERVAPG
jgi:hypothetical protein